MGLPEEAQHFHQVRGMFRARGPFERECEEMVLFQGDVC